MTQPFSPHATSSDGPPSAAASPRSLPLPGPCPDLCGPPWTCRFSLLLAPAPRLSGDGQLRELMVERLGRFGDRADLWYLAPAELRHLALGRPGEEAVVAADPAVTTWLQIRFGGRLGFVTLERDDLRRRAGSPPAGAPLVLSAPG